MHILFAEDSRMLAAPVIKMLERDGHRVTHVLDGAAAVAAYVAVAPDLVLMDVEMPAMDGLEATRKIRAIPSNKWVPIVMMTGMAGNSDLIKGLEAGADDYLFKPVDFQVLVTRMRAKQRILDLQSSYFGILENVHEGILTIDCQGRVQRYNRAAERIFGYAPGEVLGQNVNMLMPEPYKTQHDGYLANYLSSHQPKVIGGGRKVQGRRKNGEIFPMHLAVTEVESALGVQFIGLVRDISQEEEDRLRIEHLALHDVLTGLANRASFNQCLSESVRAGGAFTLLFIDIDGFKPVNDQYGHDAGDAVLVALAQRMRHAVAGRDFVARLGGDEFVVLLSEVKDVSAVVQVAARILAKIAEPIECGSQISCQVGASIGAARFPADGDSSEAILNAADNAMYQAKRAGKNRLILAGQPAPV